MTTLNYKLYKHEKSDWKHECTNTLSKWTKINEYINKWMYLHYEQIKNKMKECIWMHKGINAQIIWNWWIKKLYINELINVQIKKWMNAWLNMI